MKEQLKVQNNIMLVSWLDKRHNYSQVVPIDFSRSRTSTYIFAILKHFNINYTINPPEVAEGKSQLSNYPCTYEMALWIGLVRAEQCVYDVFCSRMTERGNGWRSKLTRTFCVKTHFFFSSLCLLAAAGELDVVVIGALAVCFVGKSLVTCMKRDTN